MKMMKNNNNLDTNNNVINSNTTKILTLIDDHKIYDSIISKLNNYKDLLILPDITYLEGLEETLEVNYDISIIIINYEIFTKNNLNLHEILQFLLNIKKNIKYSNLDIIILLKENNLEIQEKLQLIDINKIFVISNMNPDFLYNIFKNNIYNNDYSLNKDIIVNKLIHLEKNNMKIINKYDIKNNPKDISRSSNLMKIISKIPKYISAIFDHNNSKINTLTNIYKFNDLKKKYNKKLKLNENINKYTINNNKNSININTNNNTDYDLINLPISNLIKNYKKIEIILSNKEDI
jgi:hypothetical protein